MRSLVVGATGLVGSHVARSLVALGPVDRTALTRASAEAPALDIRDAEACARLVNDLRPDVVVCAAAQPFVEECERAPTTTSAINVAGTGNLARAADAAGALFVFFSSDYVFDGARGGYHEDDATAPINEYGRQKLAAERDVRARAAHLICRISGVFGVEPRRKNFVYQVIDRIGRGERVRAADDQVLCPTSAASLGDALVDLLRRGVRGTMHVVGPDALTRAEFARRVARAFGLDPAMIDGVASAELGLVARRPKDSSLSDERLRAVLGHGLPSTNDALAELRSAVDASVARTGA